MKKIPVAVHGLFENDSQGKMAREVAYYFASNSIFELIPFSFCGPDVKKDFTMIGAGKVKLVKPNDRESFLNNFYPTLENNLGENIIHNFFTHPTAINYDVNMINMHGLTAVIGTTGGDREILMQSVDEHNNGIVVFVPNTALPVVGTQSLVNLLGQEFEGKWVKEKNSGLYVRESHQGVDAPNQFYGKADTSGTAKAMIKDFRNMGITFKEDFKETLYNYEVLSVLKKLGRSPESFVVDMIRDREDQLKLGIPEDALDGHGHHMYKINTFGENSRLVKELYSKTLNFLKNSKLFKDYTASSNSNNVKKQLGYDIVSPDGTVELKTSFRAGNGGREFKLEHNINYRNAYLDGNATMVKFAADKSNKPVEKRAYSGVSVAKKLNLF